MPEETLRRLERADVWAIGLEAVLLIALVASLGGLRARPRLGFGSGAITGRAS